MKTKFFGTLGGMALAGWIASALPLPADSQTWSSDGSSANWSATTNWGGNAAPGSTSATNNTDTATFDSATGAVGTAANPILIDSASLNFQNITFTGATGSYTFGTTDGNALHFTQAGKILLDASTNLTNTSAVTETFDAPLVLENSSNNNFIFMNNSANGTGAKAGTFVIAGGISGASTYSMQFVLRGTNTNANTISGVISSGSSTNFSVLKTDSGTWYLTGQNTFNGGFLVQNGILDVNSISDSGVASALGQGTTITLGQNNAGSGTGEIRFSGAAAGGSSNRAILINNGTSGGGGIIENSVAGQTVTLSGNISSATPGSASNLRLHGVGNGILSGSITGAPALSVLKDATGKWTLSGTNTYTGTTSVTAGIFEVDGSLANTATTISAGATLQGTGSIGGAVTVNGTALLQAGIGAAGTSLSLTNGLTMSAGSKLELALGADNAHSTLSLSSAAANVFASGLQVTFANIQAGTYDNIITGLGADPGTESSWVLTNAGYTATFSFDGANIDATVSAVAAPEPSTWALLGAGLLGLTLVARGGRSRNGHLARR